MVEPLNTKAWQSALDALGAVKANQLEPDLRIGVSAYISALPSLPVVDGGDAQKLARKLAYTAEINSRRFDDDHPLVGELRKAATLITTQQQEIERLTKEHAASQAVIEVQRQKLATNAGWEAASAAESRVLSLEEEVKVLREALKPFGEYLDEVKFDLDNQGRLLPDDTEPGWTYLTAGDFRRARNALKVNGNG